MSTVQDTDTLLVNRNGQSYQVKIEDMSTVQDTDLLLINRGGQSFKVEAKDLPSNDPVTPPVIDSVTLAQVSGDRFDNAVFSNSINYSNPGSLDNTISMGAEVIGALQQKGHTSAITSVSTLNTTAPYSNYIYTQTTTEYTPGWDGNDGSWSPPLSNLFDGSTATMMGGANAGSSWVYVRPATPFVGVQQLGWYGSYCNEIRVNGEVMEVNPALSNSTTAQWFYIQNPPAIVKEFAWQGGYGGAPRANAMKINGIIITDNVPIPGVTDAQTLTFTDNTNISDQFFKKGDPVISSEGGMAITVRDNGLATDYYFYDDQGVGHDNITSDQLQAQITGMSYFNSDVNDSNKLNNKGIYVCPLVLHYSGTQENGQIQIVCGNASSTASARTMDVSGDVLETVINVGSTASNQLPKTAATLTTTGTSGTFTITVTSGTYVYWWGTAAGTSGHVVSVTPEVEFENPASMVVQQVNGDWANPSGQEVINTVTHPVMTSFTTDTITDTSEVTFNNPGTYDASGDGDFSMTWNCAVSPPEPSAPIPTWDSVAGKATINIPFGSDNTGTPSTGTYNNQMYRLPTPCTPAFTRWSSVIAGSMWIIHYSDDGVNWIFDELATKQSAALSITKYPNSSSHGSSAHRYWAMSRITTSNYTGGDNAVVTATSAANYGITTYDNPVNQIVFNSALNFDKFEVGDVVTSQSCANLYEVTSNGTEADREYGGYPLSNLFTPWDEQTDGVVYGGNITPGRGNLPNLGYKNTWTPLTPIACTSLKLRYASGSSNSVYVNGVKTPEQGNSSGENGWVDYTPYATGGTLTSIGWEYASSGNYTAMNGIEINGVEILQNGTVFSISAEQKIMQIHSGSFNVGDTVTGPEKPDSEIKAYLTLDQYGNVQNIVPNNPGLQIQANSSPNITFPGTMSTGETPNTELPVGTTIQTTIQAANVAGNSTKSSNVLMPTGSDSVFLDHCPTDEDFLRCHLKQQFQFRSYDEREELKQYHDTADKLAHLYEEINDLETLYEQG